MRAHALPSLPAALSRCNATPAVAHSQQHLVKASMKICSEQSTRYTHRLHNASDEWIMPYIHTLLYISSSGRVMSSLSLMIEPLSFSSRYRVEVSYALQTERGGYSTWLGEGCVRRPSLEDSLCGACFYWRVAKIKYGVVR